jgi:hypothetical protein
MKIGVTRVCVCLALLLCLLPHYTLANNVLVTPLLLEFDVEARDIVTREVTLTNRTQQKVVVFATVNEVAVDSTGDIKEFVSPIMSDRTNTVTSWIEITRGRIELEPGEVRNIPVTLRIHPYAAYGDYFAFIGFVESSKRPEAEVVALRGEAKGVILKVALNDTSVQSLRVTSYTSDRFIFDADNGGLSVEVENIGTVESVPGGEIIFYNSRGEEISALPFNEAKEVLQPGEKRVMTLKIPFADELGRFKANLSLRHGDTQTASVFDTTQFYMIPYRHLLMIVFGILATSIIVTFLLRKAFHEELHDEDGSNVPLYVRSDREHIEHDHDIHIKTQ